MEFNTYKGGIISLLYIQEIHFVLSWLSQQVQRFFIIQIGKQKQLEKKQWPAFHYDKRGLLPFFLFDIKQHFSSSWLMSVHLYPSINLFKLQINLFQMWVQFISIMELVHTTMLLRGILLTPWSFINFLTLFAFSRLFMQAYIFDKST